ncbi:hypothetical protein CASFOL_006191 [Castilleja foliolosa]|uniref:F-box domain-containing protein n=1 Tax=Castilleja foliolosa TaxID=1961234 RepID=A0ABD3E616_9LAMI
MVKLLKMNDVDDVSKNSSSSAQIVASIDDLLIQIIKRLPFKKLVQLKLVSKYWNSLLLDPNRCLLRNRPVVGFIFGCHNIGQYGTSWHTIFLDKSISKTIQNMPPPTNDYSLYPDYKILHSCNGLLVLYNMSLKKGNQKCYIYNPTTRKHIQLPLPKAAEYHSIIGMYLAFDPSKSPHYRVVCVLKIIFDLSWLEIYSPETGLWRDGGVLFEENKYFDCTDGVYWNGAIHWVKLGTEPREFVYLNPYCDQTPKVFPSPPLRDGSYYKRNDYSFGESCDHLHFVDAYRTLDKFIVYEMKRDYSEWFVRYNVDLPEMKMDYSGDSQWMYEHLCRYSDRRYIVVRGKNDDDSFLVIANNKRIVRYNFEQKTCETLCDFDSTKRDHSLLFSCLRHPFQYIESNCSV